MTKTLKITLAAVAAALVAASAATAKSNGTTITAAGSTFVAPLVSSWTPALGSAFGYTLQYSPVGSGAGIAAVTIARSIRRIGRAAHPRPGSRLQGLRADPVGPLGDSVAYNVPGAPVHLRLSGAVIAKIFLGQITNWNDPAIAALNAGAKMPNLKITPVYRSDGSGTTYNFTDYLSGVSSGWKTKVGNSTSVNFPAGIGAKGSSGVTGVVTRTPGAVTYVDVAYALQNHIRFAAVRNNAGKFLYPSLRRIQAAAAAFPKVPANNEMHIVNPSKANPLAYPISTYTYVIVPQQTSHAAELRKLIFWALTQGQKPQYTARLLFAPLPKNVLAASEKTLKTIHR